MCRAGHTAENIYFSGCANAHRAAQEKLPYAEEVLVLRADVDERLQRISELEHQVRPCALMLTVQMSHVMQCSCLCASKDGKGAIALCTQ